MYMKLSLAAQARIQNILIRGLQEIWEGAAEHFFFRTSLPPSQAPKL